MNPREIYAKTDDLSPLERLGYRPGDAAKALGISLSHLDRLTKHGRIPVARLGSLRIYPVEALRDWLASQAHLSEEACDDAN